MSNESCANINTLTLDSLPVGIYNRISEFLDYKSLHAFLKVSPHITVSEYLIEQSIWRHHDATTWAWIGNLKALKHLHTLGRKFTDPNAMFLSCAEGYSEAVKYSHSIEAPRCSHIIGVASDTGHLEVVKFLHSIGIHCDDNAIDRASHAGNLDAVKFLYSIGATCSEQAMEWASKKGHLEVVKYLHSIRAPRCSYIISVASSYGQLEVVKYLQSIRGAL